MSKSYESLSLFEFQQIFATDNQCLAYLSAEKWKNGYACPKCGHTHYCAGGSLYSRQCTPVQTYRFAYCGYTFS